VIETHRPDRRTHLHTRHPSSPRRTRRAPLVLVLVLTSLGALFACAAPAAAQRARPWVPPASDSLAVRAAEARALFHAQTSDTITQQNFRAYELVGLIARDLVRSLGRTNLRQAEVIESTLDSLGFETAVRVDPQMPEFALVSVRNPDRASAFAMGFIYWYRGNLLHQQGSQLPSGRDPRLRVWHSGRVDRPYTMCILDRSPDGHLGWVVYGLSASGDFFSVVQAMGSSGASGLGQGAFVDADGDGQPELALWTRAKVDSLFTLCPECPGPIESALFSFRDQGFELEETHEVPTAIGTFSMFVHFLQQGNRTSAARLLEDPKRVDEALALGWGAQRAAGAWSFEYAEPGARWPRWIAMRLDDAKRQLYIVRFTRKAGRLVIQTWLPVKPAAARPPVPPAPTGGGGR
jgi:hypothetical protein